MKKAMWLAVGLVSLGGSNLLVSACECGPRPTPIEARNTADVVMEVYVVNKGEAVADLTRYDVSVSKVWKGQPTKHATVHMRELDASCQAKLESGKNYLLYLNGANLVADVCSRTFDPKTQAARLDYSDDLAALKKAK